MEERRGKRRGERTRFLQRLQASDGRSSPHIFALSYPVEMSGICRYTQSLPWATDALSNGKVPQGPLQDFRPLDSYIHRTFCTSSLGPCHGRYFKALCESLAVSAFSGRTVLA